MILGERIVKARKEHNEDAFWHIINFGGNELFTREENEIFEARRKLKGKIQKGEEYCMYTVKDGGELYTNRESIELRELCCKYQLFEE